MITLIGGSGFIGTNLANKLHQSEKKFIIIDRVESHYWPSKTRKADIRFPDEFTHLIPEGSVIVNLAAVHRDDIRPKNLYDENNVDGARNVCAAARLRKCDTIIFTSSVAVYGFAPPNTDERGEINYFNDYGRTKWAAEKIYREWYEEDPENRTLVIVRPTVVFGKQNRGNVYNLLEYVASGKFYMVGNGKNKKSMAYVENIAAFLEFATENFPKGFYLYNFIDKPDLDMKTLVSQVQSELNIKHRSSIRIPFAAGYMVGLIYDGLSFITGKAYQVSSIRIKKFCATTQFDTSIAETGFQSPYTIEEGLKRTLIYEFREDHPNDPPFYTE